MAAPALAALRTRVRDTLVDTSAAFYANAQVDEALRQALEALNKAAGAAYLIKDLDAAASTTVPEADCGILVIGAAGLCVSFAAADLSLNSGMTLEQAVPLRTWAAAQDVKFQSALLGMKNRLHQHADTVPWVEWPLEEPNTFDLDA